MLAAKQTSLSTVALVLLVPFSAALVHVSLRRKTRRVWLLKHGLLHRLLGAAELLLFAVYACDAALPGAERRTLRVCLDVALGFSGVALTLSAAASFSRGHIHNRASGALEVDSTVTRAEMLEHAFYQGLNCCQLSFLYALQSVATRSGRSLLCLVATAPWLLRHRFPVHSFSANYQGQPVTRENLLYRLKKWQYMIYKHVLLHGLNVSCAIGVSPRPASDRSFRIYWLGLNGAYVLEFFMQTLVKRRLLLQSTMLRLNALLMAACTCAALPIMLRVQPLLACLSLALNMARRGHDFSNTALVLAAGWLAG